MQLSIDTAQGPLGETSPCLGPTGSRDVGMCYGPGVTLCLNLYSSFHTGARFCGTAVSSWPSAGWTGAMARGSHLPLYASMADSGPCEGGSLFDRSPASDMASRLVPGSFTLTRLIVAVPLTDRFICHLVMVTCWDGFTAPVPLTLGCLKSDAASLSLSGGLSAAGITSPPASLFL